MKKRQVILILLLILAFGLVVIAAAIKNEQVKKGGLESSTSGNPSSGQSSNTQGQDRPRVEPGDQPEPSQTVTDTKYAGTTLKAPTGQLLSKHLISLSSTSVETGPDENSTCQTVPGATCDIKLTGPNGTIKYVGAKAVDGAGGANYYWNAKTIGLTPGKWKVEAVAVKGGQTAVSAADTLEVQS